MTWVLYSPPPPPPPPPPPNPSVSTIIPPPQAVLPAYRHHKWQMFMQRCCHSKVLVHDSSQICCLQSITLPLSLTTSGEDRKKEEKKEGTNAHRFCTLSHILVPYWLFTYIHYLVSYTQKTNFAAAFCRMKVYKHARTCMLFTVLTADTDFKWGGFI